jgi:hypothetical protein
MPDKRSTFVMPRADLSERLGVRNSPRLSKREHTIKERAYTMKVRSSLFALFATGAVALGGVALAATPAVAAPVSYQATLTALNHSSASGTLMLTLDGDQATIT